MINHHSAKFGGHEYLSCGDKLFFVVEEQDFTCSLNPSLLFIYNAHGMNAHSPSFQYVRYWSHPLKAAIAEKKRFFCQPSKNINKKERKKISNTVSRKAFCITHIRGKQLKKS